MSQTEPRPRLFHIEQSVYPYRFPLFERLAHYLDVSVFYCKSKKAFRRWDTSLPDERPYPARVLPRIPLGPLTLNFTLPIHLARSKPDVYSVDAVDRITLPQILVALAWAKLKRRPFILVDEFLETPWYRTAYPLKHRLNNRLRRSLYPHVDAFVAWSPRAVDYIRAQGVPAERIFTGPVFWPSEPGSGDRFAVDGPDGRPAKVILAISYLLPRKGVDHLITAFQGLARADTVLVIAGTGVSAPDLKRLARGDPRIRFLGYVVGREKASWLASADVFVLPTLWDPWGLVVNEAMYHGLPIISTDAAGCSSYLVRDNGFVVPAGDPQALGAALTRLLDDDDLRQRMGQRSFAIIKECTLEAQLQPILDAVAYVLRNRPVIASHTSPMVASSRFTDDGR